MYNMNMDNLKKLLTNLKKLGCSGIKVSFEDEGALLNEIITMRYLTACTGIGLSVKIGGCEAKRDIVECIDISCDAIVAPMIESAFALNKFFGSLKQYGYNQEKGFNLETINAYNCLEELSTEFKNIDFVTVGRVDFVGSLNKDRGFVNSDEMFSMVHNVFKRAKEENTKCYLGGAISIDSKDFIGRLISDGLLDKFETRYIIFDVHKIDFSKFEELLHLANVFEVEWLKYVNYKYSLLANKDIQRIKMIEDRISKNNSI
jgi:hypothetical protein